MIHAYCDGSIYPNPGGPMGWGFVAIDMETGEVLKEHSEGRPAHPENTNNKGEICGLLRTLQWLKGRDAHIFTDSQYVQQGSMVWVNSWAARGWKKKKDGVWGEVPNASLWKAILQNKRPNQKVLWVRGHNGQVHNERADRLALQGRLGVTPQEHPCPSANPSTPAASADPSSTTTGTARESAACA